MEKTERGVSPATGKKKKKKKKKGWVINLVLVLILLIGAGIMAYPTFSDWWNSFHQTRAIASYINAVENTDTAVLEQMLADARAYNERLAVRGNHFTLSDEERLEYESLLDLTGSGVIGYINIESIGVYLPFYHGTDEAVLQVAIGHLEGTSLPVGGPDTHAVLSGHRGLPSAKLFSDLDQIEKGNIFTVTVLNQLMTYEVDQIHVVLPDNTEDLNIAPGEDYCTLITCTPYGVNTHRLLIRGHRIPNLHGDAIVAMDAILFPKYITVPAVGIPMLFMFLAAMLIRYRRRTSFAGKSEGAGPATAVLTGRNKKMTRKKERK